MIAGFEDVTAGEIRLCGDNFASLEPNHRPVNTVYQHYALFPHRSVIDNVVFGRKMKGVDLGARRMRAGQMLEKVHLSAFARRLPSQLSGGTQQRVALAQVLAPEPKVLLLHKPLSALDLNLWQAMRVELTQLREDTAITFIFVSHDQEEALTMSDRIAVLSNGRVQQVRISRSETCDLQAVVERIVDLGTDLQLFTRLAGNVPFTIRLQNAARAVRPKPGQIE